jgi:hypothetical protein
MKQLQKMLAAAAGHLPDGLMVGGAGAVSYGAGLVYAPAGWMVAGVFLMAAGYLAARGGR